MELSKLRRKLVKLSHPDRFAQEPEKQETYHRLTAAINHAANTGDFATLWKIADDPHGFILRQGWAALDLLAQLRRLWDSRFARLNALGLSKGIELEIIRVLEAGHALEESPDYELHRLTTQTPAFFDETVRRHVGAIQKELAALEREAEELAREIEELTGEAAAEIG